MLCAFSLQQKTFTKVSPSFLDDILQITPERRFVSKYVFKNLFPLVVEGQDPLFLCVFCTSLLKTHSENCLQTSNFFYSHRDFGLLTHYKTTNFRHFKAKSLQMTNSNLMKMAESYTNG